MPDCFDYCITSGKEPLLTINDIATRLGQHQPQLVIEQQLTSAAVALILRETTNGVQVLFIERAVHPDDPWSGNLAFPGGKVEPADRTERAAAERETLEEIDLDLDLGPARYLGRLSDVTGEHLPVRISCFVFALDASQPFRLSDEITDVFWTPLAALEEPERQTVITVHFAGETYSRPAIRLLPPERPVLWGITYRLVQQFLQAIHDAPDASRNRGQSPA